MRWWLQILWHLEKHSEKASPGFSYSDWMYNRLFVKRNQMARHKWTVDHPGQVIVVWKLKKVSTLPRSLLLSSPNFKNYPCRYSKSVPLGPEPPKHFFAWPIWPHHMWCSRRKFCVSLYVSNIEQEGIFLFVIFRPGKIYGFVNNYCSIQGLFHP